MLNGKIVLVGIYIGICLPELIGTSKVGKQAYSGRYYICVTINALGTI